MLDSKNSDFFPRLLDSLSDGIYFIDRESRITYWNKAAERLTGLSASEVLGKSCHNDLLMHTDENGRPLCQTPNCLAKSVIADGSSREKLVYLRHKDGHRIPVMAKTSPMLDELGNILGAVELISDATSTQVEKRQLENLEAAAMLDHLTGVSNRRYAEMFLRDRLGTFERHGLSFGTLFIDIDYFKQINDTYGHEIGDAVLKMVASTLHNGIRDSDLVARWGGEEFVVILTGCSESDLKTMAKKLRRLVEHSSLSQDKKNIRVTVSIGAAAVPPPVKNTSEIVARADAMMYEAKRMGRNRVCVEGELPCNLQNHTGSNP